MSVFPWPKPQIHAEAWVAETAVVIGNVQLAAGASLWPTAVARGDVGSAQSELREAVSVIQRVCSKGVIHRNQAARRISRLNKAVKAIATR